MTAQYPVMECGAPGAMLLGVATSEEEALEVVLKWVRDNDDYSWLPTIVFNGAAFVAEWRDGSAD